MFGIVLLHLLLCFIKNPVQSFSTSLKVRHIFEDIPVSPFQPDYQPDYNRLQQHPRQPALLQKESIDPRQMDQERLELSPRLFYILF